MIKYLCPKCRGQLVKKGNSYYCKEGHCYDIAKEGYINLHLTNKKSELIGDNKSMVIARRDFLELGHYRKLADKLCEIISSYINKESVVLDCGCGSGYYTNIFLNSLKLNSENLLAIDISKEGIKLAQKKSKNVTFAIASAYDLPLEDKSVDIIVSIFAPYAIDEMQRVLKPNGKVIFVSPNRYHLWELKQAIYGENIYEKEFSIDFAPLKEIEKINLSYDFKLNTTEDINNLICMTPYAYKTPKQLLEKSKDVLGKNIKADFVINVFSNM